MSYQEVLAHMQAGLEQDIATIRKRNIELKNEASMAGKHAAQCELMDASTRFGQLQLTSKTAMMKAAHVNQHRQAHDMLAAAERGLDDEVSSG